MSPGSALAEALCDSGLWLDLHCAATYYSTSEDQRLFLSRIREALAEGDLKPAFREIARDPAAAGKVDRLFTLKDSPGFAELTGKYLSALAAGIERELLARRPIAVSQGLTDSIRKTFVSLSFFDGADVLEISETGENACAYVNYISGKYSPLYDGKEGAWDRDTQFKIELLFDSGLFVWLSANVAAPFRGRGMGSEIISKCEEAAGKMGFRRFSVPGPNREFWRKFGYRVDPKQIVVIDQDHNPNLETYKETA